MAIIILIIYPMLLNDVVHPSSTSQTSSPTHILRIQAFSKSPLLRLNKCHVGYQHPCCCCCCLANFDNKLSWLPLDCSFVQLLASHHKLTCIVGVSSMACLFIYHVVIQRLLFYRQWSRNVEML